MIAASNGRTPASAPAARTWRAVVTRTPARSSTLGTTFPAEYRGALFTHNVLGSRINQEKLVPSGSGYIGSHAPDFMRANDRWFRGLRLELGPDGSLFNSDWYDARACHQQHPQDRTNGRIYKISYGQPKPVKVDLSKLCPAPSW
jgi:hypothetical protein